LLFDFEVVVTFLAAFDFLLLKRIDESSEFYTGSGRISAFKDKNSFISACRVFIPSKTLPSANACS
jgi:Na+(H+)/acetate symporter ActP